MAASKRLIEAVAVTAELCGRAFTPAAARVFVDDLAGFPEDAVLGALTRCRREVKGALTLQDVISRLDDGRLGAEEAWAMLPRDEATTVVWTEEMAAAWGVAQPLLADGDRVAARMAFKAAYTKYMTLARDARKPAKWTASLGHDPRQRESVLLEAVQEGRLSTEYVRPMLPYRDDVAALARLEQAMGKKLLKEAE